MADRSILYRLRAALQGGFVAVANEIELLASLVGVATGSNNIETAIRRLDGTGVGSSIFRFTGNYAAQASNIDEWFGGRQLTRLRCTSNGGFVPATFTLPGTTALTTAFDQLSTNGLPEVLNFVIEYTGPANAFLSIVPRTGGPTIQGATNIVVRSGVAAQVEITRTSGTISSYVFSSIGGISDTQGSPLDAIKLINPANAVWNASANGTLPSTGVIKGNAYRVANAPSDGSGRFGEVMQNGDYVVWSGESFTSWAATPPQWFVIPAHDVRRITGLEADFLTTLEITPESDRNTVVRGANYADTANEIRLKIYAQRSDYDAADLNTTGDIDEYTDPADQTGYLGIRLPGTLSTNTTILPTLYVYAENNGVFTRLLNLQNDFSHQGDFTTESDYLSNDTINYAANSTLRIYVGTLEDRYNSPDLDVTFSNLSADLQRRIGTSTPSGNSDSQRIATLESKVNALFPLTPDVTALDSWADVIGPARSVQETVITDGYSKIADFRDSGTRYESPGVVYDDTGTNVIRYTGLGDNLYRTFGFKVTAPADQVLMWLVDGSTLIPFVDMTAAGNFRINAYGTEVGPDQRVTNEIHFLTKTAGPATLAANDGNVQTFTVQPFPANSTNQSRTLDAEIKVFINNVDTLAAHFIDPITLPSDNTAQSREEIRASIFLGPVYNSRTVNVTMGYTLRVSGNDLLIDFELLSAPSDIEVSMGSVVTNLNYTAAGAISRVDNFTVFNDFGTDYTFTGENELLLTFHPIEGANFMNAVAAAIGTTGNATEFNDINVPYPGHSFESVEIPDTIDFRTFSPVHFLRHTDLSHLLQNRNVEWCYGLARVLTVRELTVTGPVDFVGPTIGGNKITSVIRSAGVPTITPESTEQFYFDTTNKILYYASDTGGSGDWISLN